MIPIDRWNEKYGRTRSRLHHVMPDIQPYIAVTGDMAGQEISSRKEHRAFLKRNKLEEVGNEKSYMMKNGGMDDGNPNLKSDKQYEEEVCRSLMDNLERLRQRQ